MGWLLVHRIPPRGHWQREHGGGNHEAKLAHVENGSVHQVLVYRGDVCVGWCQYGPPVEVATIKNAKSYQKDLVDLPDWRIGCVFTGSGCRRQGAWRVPDSRAH